MKRTYLVHIDSRPVDAVLDDDLLDAFFVALSRERRLRGPSSTANTATQILGATTAVDTTGAPQALAVAASAFLRAAKHAKIGRVEIGEATVELDTGDENDRQELVSGADVARRLGVSRQRIAQLAATKGRFPTPLAAFGVATVWRWGDIADWAEVNGRRLTRRPRRKAS